MNRNIKTRYNLHIKHQVPSPAVCFHCHDCLPYSFTFSQVYRALKDQNTMQIPSIVSFVHYLHFKTLCRKLHPLPINALLIASVLLRREGAVSHNKNTKTSSMHPPLYADCRVPWGWAERENSANLKHDVDNSRASENHSWFQHQRAPSS